MTEIDMAKAKLIEYLDYWQRAKKNIQHDIDNLPWEGGKAPDWMIKQIKWIEDFEKEAFETLALFDDPQM